MSVDFEEVLIGYFDSDKVDEMEFERTSNGMTRIIAHLKEGNHFTYTDTINWGNSLEEFYDVLDRFTCGVSYTFNDFDPQEDIERRQEEISNFYGDY